MTRTSRGRTTLRDVAAHAGVSTTTVSFVLAGRSDMRISAETEDRVRQSARMLGYRRRRSHRAVPGAPVIGLVSDLIGTESFAGEMIRGCVTAAAERDHAVLMVESQADPGLEASAIDALLERGVDRIVYGSQDNRPVTVPPALSGVRTVLLNCVDARHPGPAVFPDEYAAGHLAATTLLEHGHSDRIWLVGEIPAHAHAGRRRLHGIRDALASAGRTLAGHVECGWWPDAARTAATSVFTTEQPTAVIAINDRAAMGVFQSAANLGRTVPGDLSVISFDNSDLARWLDPGLTSIALPHAEMGRRAVELVLDEGSPSGTHAIPMRLHVRESLAHPGPDVRRSAATRRHDAAG